MNRFMGSLLAVAFAVSLAPFASATAATTCPAGQTYTKAYTKADGTKVSGYCSAHGAKPAAAATSASKMAPAAAATKAAAPHAMATAKAAPGAMATAAGSMSKSATSTTKSAAGATSCPPGKTYVNGYTKQNGTKVAGYCRSAPSK